MINAISASRPAHFSRPRFAACPGVLALCAALAGPVAASEPLLTLTGADGRETALDLEALDALPQHEFSTETQWTWEEKSFRGPLLIDVLKTAGLPGPGEKRVIELVADDGFHARVDLSEKAQYLTDTYPIVTTRIDGAPFPLEENGPLWVMFPYGGHPDLDVEAVHDMTVWQIVEIVEIPE